MGQMQGPRGRTLVIVRNVRNRTLCTATFEAFPLVFLGRQLTPSRLFILSNYKRPKILIGRELSIVASR